MNAESYLKAAEKVRIKVIGLNSTGKIVDSVRPDTDRLREVCEVREHRGVAYFRDTAVFKAPKTATEGNPLWVNKIELWYGDEMVASRTLPDVVMYRGDKLKIGWGLTISRDMKIQELVILP